MAAKFKRNTSFSTAKADGDSKPRLEDLFQVMPFPDGGEWLHVRFVGPVVSYGYHWVSIITKNGKAVTLPKLCLSYDSVTETHDSTKKCPYCKLDNQRFSKTYYSNAIIRSLEEEIPAKLPALGDEEEESGFKTMGSKSWTPIRVIRMPATVVGKLQKLAELNFVTDKKTGKKKYFDISHEKYGLDCFVAHNSKVKGTDAYSVAKHERTALDETETEFLCWDIEDRLTPEDYEEAKREAATLANQAPDKEDTVDTTPTAKSGSKVGGKKKPIEDDDELDLDDDDDDEDEPAPKKPAKKKPTPVYGDDDEDEPVKPAKKKKPAVDEDDDDFDDEPAPKKAAAKKAVVEDDDDFDDEPAKPAKKKPAASDDFDLDADFDD